MQMEPSPTDDLQTNSLPTDDQPVDSPPPVTIKSSYRVTRNIRYVIEAVIAIAIGVGLSTLLATTLIVVQAGRMITSENGWYALLNYDQMTGNFLERAAVSYLQPGTNSPEEAVYWQTTVDGNRQTLNGANNYVIHFPAGELPPNDAFWSLTITDAKGRMVANSINRNSLSSHADLQFNADGSIDFYIQSTAPSGNQSNWLPAPDGDYKLWLRVYQPGASVLSGAYQVPPVVEVN